MKLSFKTSPYIRKNVSVSRMMLDVIIALMPVTIFALVQNKGGAISVLLISILTMVLFELISIFFIKWPKDFKFRDLFTKEGFFKVKNNYTINNFLAPIISGMIFALTLPAYCNWYVVFIGALFGIIIGKMVFGGLGQNIFNPAATGRVFVAICFGDRINEAYHLQGSYDAIASATPLQTNLVQSQYSLFDLFLGNVPGSMGEVSTLLILLGALYLFIRRSADLRAFLGFMLSFMALTFVAVISGFGKVDGQSLFDTYLYQIMAGGALFGATFMITDPVTSPVTKFGRVLFGVIAGSLVVLIRISGALPEGVVFSILIANTLAPTMDYLMRGRKHSYPWQGLLIMGVYLILIGIVISSKVMGGWF